MDFTIAEILPHRPPMVMIDSISEWDGESARGVKVFREDDYASSDAGLAEVILIECLAQTVAAMSGLNARQSGHPPGMGMLVGVDHFEIHAPPVPQVETQLLIKVENRLGPFLLVHGKALQKSEVIAEGNLKFYIEAADLIVSSRTL